ncbi:MAG: hypothetical protein GXP45_04885 [bacterium]|nr:hypothetical protein [bacterium]
MLRRQFMQKRIHAHNIKYVIGHNGSIYIKSTVSTLLVLFLLYVIFVITRQYTTYPYLSWIFGAFGMILLIKYAIDFLNLYLDGIALSEE